MNINVTPSKKSISLISKKEKSFSSSSPSSHECENVNFFLFDFIFSHLKRIKERLTKVKSQGIKI